MPTSLIPSPMEEMLGIQEGRTGGCQALDEAIASCQMGGRGAPSLLPPRQSLGIPPVLVPAPDMRGPIGSSHQLPQGPFLPPSCPRASDPQG